MSQTFTQMLGKVKEFHDKHNFANKDQSFWIDKVIVAGNNKIAEKIKFSTKKVIVANNPTDEEMIKTLLKNI